MCPRLTATRVPCPASSPPPPGGGLSFAGRRAALGPAPAATVSLAMFLPASGERRQQSADFNSSPPPPASVLRTRILLWPMAALRLPPAKYSPLPPVAAFAFSALRLRLRFGSPCGGRRRAAGSASGRHHARATELFLPIRRHHPASSCCAAADHASSFSAVGYCQGRASVRFVPVARSSFAALGCGSTLAAVGADAGHRPSIHRHPRPGERSSCRSGASQPLLAALTTLSVCLAFAPTTQAGTRQPYDAANLSASTVPSHAAPLRITPRCCRSPATA